MWPLKPKHYFIILKQEFRSSHPGVFIRKGVLKICSKFTGEHPWQSVISIKLQSNFIEIALRYEFSPVNLLHSFRTSFLKSTSRWLLLKFLLKSQNFGSKNLRRSNFFWFRNENTALIVSTAQKMKFSIKDFFSKLDQICSFLWIWSYLLKKC